MFPIKFKHINIIAFKKINTKNDVCLCKCDLLAPTINEINEKKIYEPICIGSCNHGFHEQCINNYLTNNYIICPICKTHWNELSKISKNDLINSYIS